MTRALIVTLLCVALWQAAASADTPDIQNPVWLQQPNAEDFANNYPSQAIDQYVEGRATIECFVRLDTTLTCHVTAESPASWGFGDAALAVARSFRVEPARINGEPTEGGRIRRTIRFVMPEAGPPSPNEPTPTYSLPLDLPAWEDAPTSAAVLLATPESARTAGTQGRGVLSCRVDTERRLACEPVTEMPAGTGFAAAAMTLVPQFRVSTSSAKFLTDHATEPFILPISFGSGPTLTPVNRNHAGMAPLVAPTLQAPMEAYPPAALAARVSGSAAVLCNVLVDDLDCALESETPPGWGFGDMVLWAADNLPMPPPETGLIPGDQVRLIAEFNPEPAE